MLGIRDWMFVAPVFIGDTLTFRLEIQGVRTTRTGDRGNIDAMVRSRFYREA